MDVVASVAPVGYCFVCMHAHRNKLMYRSFESGSVLHNISFQHTHTHRKLDIVQEESIIHILLCFPASHHS